MPKAGQGEGQKRGEEDVGRGKEEGQSGRGEMVEASQNERVQKHDEGERRFAQGWGMAEAQGGGKHDRKCRIFQRFPGWAFPKDLHDAVKDGWIFEEEARFDYAGPKPDELVAFAEKDEQGRIENLRNLSKLDFAEIET